MSIVMSALEPPQRERLKKALARARQSGDEEHHDRLVREAVNHVEASLQALKDILGYGENGEDRDDSTDSES